MDRLDDTIPTKRVEIMKPPTPLTTHQKWVKGFYSVVAGASFSMSELGLSFSSLNVVRAHFNPNILRSSDIASFISQYDMQTAVNVLKHVPNINVSTTVAVGFAVMTALTLGTGIFSVAQVFKDEPPKKYSKH